MINLFEAASRQVDDEAATQHTVRLDRVSDQSVFLATQQVPCQCPFVFLISRLGQFLQDCVGVDLSFELHGEASSVRLLEHLRHHSFAQWNFLIVD